MSFQDIDDYDYPQLPVFFFVLNNSNPFTTPICPWPVIHLLTHLKYNTSSSVQSSLCITVCLNYIVSKKKKKRLPIT